MRDLARWMGVMACVGLIGCTSNEEKILKVIQPQIEACKASQDDFAEVETVDGKVQILTDACRMPLEGPVLVDEFHARANTGPYFWIVNLSKEHSIWTLNEVVYDPVHVAKREMEAKGATDESLAKADSMFAEAEKAMPENEWIRVSRVNNALRLRGMVRGKDTANPGGLGDAQPIVDQNLEWAKDKPEAHAKILLAVIEHYGDYYGRLESSAENLGSRDDWYRASIEQAQKDGDKETVQEYTAELEKQIAERPAERQKLVDRMGQIFDSRCKYIGQLKADGIEDSSLKERVSNLSANAKCTPDARPKVEDYGEAPALE